MASINLTFHEDQDDEALLVVPPALPFAAQMASSTQSSIHPPTVVIADYAVPERYNDHMVPWNNELVEGATFNNWRETDSFDLKTRCISLFHSKELCLQLEQRLRAKIHGDQLDLTERGAGEGARIIKGGWGEFYPNVARKNVALQSQAVFCIWARDHLKAFNKSVEGMFQLIEDLMDQAAATPVMQGLLGDNGALQLEQANIFLGVGNGAEAFGYHRDDEDNTKGAGSEQTVSAVLTTVTMLSVAAGTMHVAGADNEFEYEVGKTAMFHPSLFHRSGIVFPGTLKLACHWGIKVKNRKRPLGASPGSSSPPGFQVKQENKEKEVKEEAPPLQPATGRISLSPERRAVTLHVQKDGARSPILISDD